MMQRFLEACASYIYNKYSKEFNELCIVFPNRRSGAFFTSYLKKQLTKPVIGPEIITVNELMKSFSPLHTADRLLLISILYDVFRQETGSKETFDEFYFWGEVLLADFDDIDKYKASAADVFRNLSEIKEIENLFDYLTDEQKRMLEMFWDSLRNWEHQTHEKDFITIWEKLFGVYDRYKQELLDRGIAFSGMQLRDGIDKLASDQVALPKKKHLIIGMNALNTCEKQFFDLLKLQDRADFFWDYDSYYVENKVNDAGKFMRENLLNFPPPNDFNLQTKNFCQSKHIELVSVASSYGQVQVIPRVFESFDSKSLLNHDNTAIVLADESLLFPALGAIPECIEQINVTMGYPINNSPVVNFIMHLAALLRNTKPVEGHVPKLYFNLVSNLLTHQMLSTAEPEKVALKLAEIKTRNQIYIFPPELYFSTIHQKIFTLPTGVETYTGWFISILQELYQLTGETNENVITKELIYIIYTALEKLQSTISETLKAGKAEITPTIFFRLMNQYINQLSVPYEGEPLTGLQVMGILETRCLDFENVIIIGLNEEIWPRTFTAPSLIPFNLRKGFGLPGIDDQDAMYSYYFYRLIQRAKNVTATYSVIREGISTGELSRFGFQLLLNSPHQVIRKNFDFAFLSQPAKPIKIYSNNEIAGALLMANQTGKPLSPSAINTYLTCKLKYYFKYFEKLKEADEVNEDIDRQAFGNIFHKAVESLYLPFQNQHLDEATIKKLINDRDTHKKCILKAFTTEYFKLPESEWNKIEIEGKAILIFSTIEMYVLNLLKFDLKYLPLKIHSLERSFETKFNIKIDEIDREITIGGKIDRIDEIDGFVRVIDYKTGTLLDNTTSYKDLEVLFDRSKRFAKKEVTQSLIYAYVLKKSYFTDSPIEAAIYAILKMNDDNFNPLIRSNRIPFEISTVVNELELYLKNLLQEIYSASNYFDQTEFREDCKYCPFNIICSRN